MIASAEKCPLNIQSELSGGYVCVLSAIDARYIHCTYHFFFAQCGVEVLGKGLVLVLKCNANNLW